MIRRNVLQGMLGLFGFSATTFAPKNLSADVAETIFVLMGDEYHTKNGVVFFVKRLNGDKEWFVNGERHREDGPAIEWADGSKYWYEYGKFCRKELA